jgi:hypothetical protein
MSYLEQILGGAQQLSEEQFNSIFQSFMQPQQTQPNLGMGQAPLQKAQLRDVAKDTNVAGEGMMAAETQAMGKLFAPSDTNPGLLSMYDATQDYGTDMFSTQNRMLAEQDMGMGDDEDDWRKKMRDGLKSLFY